MGAARRGVCQAGSELHWHGAKHHVLMIDGLGRHARTAFLPEIFQRIEPSRFIPGLD